MIVLGVGLTIKGPAEPIVHREPGSHLPSVPEVPLKVVPQNLSESVDAIFRSRELLTWKKKIRKLVSSCGGNLSVSSIDDGLIIATIVELDFGVGAVVRPHFKQVISLHFGQVVLQCIEIFVVCIR